jgi:hypothetical protein
MCDLSNPRQSDPIKQRYCSKNITFFLQISIVSIWDEFLKEKISDHFTTLDFQTKVTQLQKASVEQDYLNTGRVADLLDFYISMKIAALV